MLEMRGLGSFLNAWCAQPLFGSQQTAGAEARADQDAVRRAQNPSGLARSLREFGLARMPEASQALESTQIPTTLVVGSSDQKFLALAEQLVGRSQNQRLCLEVVEGAGHNVLLERPEALVDVVRRARDAAAAQLAPARELSAGRAGSA
jgi:2-succinyl-6-hydroxy-2,4-cyclohexadiene-1-carboxylate synthase